MSNLIVLLLGAAFFVSSAYFLVLKQERRNVLLNRLQFRRRRTTSGSNTPPRSLSPGEKKTNDVPTPDYSETFPPSRRFTLADIQSDLSSVLGKSRDELVASPPGSRKACLPLAASYLDTGKPMFTPTEFSTEEIKALGNFPDYATLSGVPLPRPYHEFDIKKALPRPYRPFRWNYHQTMCK